MKKIYFAIVVLSIGLLVLYVEWIPKVKQTDPEPVLEQTNLVKDLKPPLSSKSNSNPPIKEETTSR